MNKVQSLDVIRHDQKAMKLSIELQKQRDVLAGHNKQAPLNTIQSGN